MFRFSRIAGIALAAASGLTCTLASAVTFPVFNTGVDDHGQPLPLGALDPHWTVTAGPGITQPQPAVVLTSQRNFLGTYYPTTDSRWIWVTASGVAGFGSPYTFSLSFDLTGFDPATFTVSGAWGVDNIGTVKVNGANPVGQGAINNITVFTTPNAFTLTGPFHAGINTLDLQVTDLGAVGGLNITALSAAANPVPEPGTWGLMAAGLVALCLRTSGVKQRRGGMQG